MVLHGVCLYQLYGIYSGAKLTIYGNYKTIHISYIYIHTPIYSINFYSVFKSTKLCDSEQYVHLQSSRTLHNPEVSQAHIMFFFFRKFCMICEICELVTIIYNIILYTRHIYKNIFPACVTVLV